MADPAVTQQIDSDRINVIVALSSERHPAFDGVPTATEQGYDLVLSGWFGVFAPEGTDKAVVDTISAPLKEMVESDAYREQVLRMGLLPAYRDPSGTDAAVGDDLVTFTRIRDAAGISIN